MWERVTAAVGASALAGFIAGAAVMGSYAAQQAPPPCPEQSVAPDLPLLGSMSERMNDAASPWACRIGPVPCAFAHDVSKLVAGDVPVLREVGMAGEFLAHT